MGNIILVTGATGFVGSRLARALVDKGSQVHVILRIKSEVKQLESILDKIILHRYDGTMESMYDIMTRVSPSIVYHLASLFISEHNSKEIRPLIESNLIFGTQLVEAMKLTGTMRLVNTGTSWQHYQNDEYNPVNLYAATKKAFEDILRYYIETSKLQVITLKLYDTYGSNDPRPKLIHLLKHLADSGKEIAMSSGEQMIDLVHVDDVANAFLIAGRQLLDKQESYSDYAISSGTLLSLKELVQITSNILNKKLKIKWGERPYRDREVFVPWDNGNILPLWKPTIELREGLSKLLLS